VDIGRIYTDSQGETHFEEISVDLAEVDFAPPAAPLLISKPIATQNALFCEIPDNWDGSWHPTPARQYAIVLSGVVEVEVSDGEVRRAVAGEVGLLEDTSGKGHATRAVPGSKASLLFIQLPD
jgi:hypothetical protein